MSEKYKATTGISYQFGGEWHVAAAGEDVEMDEKHAKAALASGAITASGRSTPTPIKPVGPAATPDGRPADNAASKEG